MAGKIREYLVSTLEGDDRIILERQFEIVELVTEHCSPVDLNYPSCQAEIQQLLDDVVEKVLYEVVTPAEGAVEFMTEASKILANSADE